MNRKELSEYIKSQYNIISDRPWTKYPDFEVFRHEDNGKWFALVMDVPKEKLVPEENGNMDIVNVKCDPVMIGSLIDNRGFFGAYHMNKTNWISVALDGTADDEKVKMLVDLSFEMTKNKKK